MTEKQILENLKTLELILETKVARLKCATTKKEKLKIINEIRKHSLIMKKRLV